MFLGMSLNDQVLQSSCSRSAVYLCFMSMAEECYTYFLEFLAVTCVCYPNCEETLTEYMGRTTLLQELNLIIGNI